MPQYSQPNPDTQIKRGVRKKLQGLGCGFWRVWDRRLWLLEGLGSTALILNAHQARNETVEAREETVDLNPKTQNPKP